MRVWGRQEPYYRRNGWVRGLIHFHTQFSDGWGTVDQAAEIARTGGFDFLIVTDHLRDLKLKTGRTPEEYVAACERASARSGIPVIPGGEIEIAWERPGVDRSEAHTLAFSIRPLLAAGAFDWATPGEDPFWHWEDEEGRRKTIAAVQRTLRAHGLPRAASHQFQHSFLGVQPGAHPDYRYDLARIPACDYLDFFYSGAVDVMHEPEDIALVAQHNREGPPLKAVYASCDYHLGREVVPPALDPVLRGIPALTQAYRWLFRTVTSTLEQITHATYVYLGDRPCQEEAILEALACGRTCVTRGSAEFAFLLPVPDLQRRYPAPALRHRVAGRGADLLRALRHPLAQRELLVVREGAPPRRAHLPALHPFQVPLLPYRLRRVVRQHDLPRGA